MNVVAEKIAEATRKCAALQSDLQAASMAAESQSGGGGGGGGQENGIRKRRRVRLLNKSTPEETSSHKSMHSIKLAFSEFYLSLILLQNYQTLNFTGFRKILKKHDKVPTSCNYKFNHYYDNSNEELFGFTVWVCE